MELVINILTAVVFALIFICFILGLLRGWKRSLARLICVVVAVVASIFLTPIISKWFISKFTDGTTLSIASLNIDFEQIVSEVAGDKLELGELFAEGSTTNALAVSLMNIAINLVLFMVLFIAINVVSLIVYWIILLIVKVKSRNKEKEEVDLSKKWALRFLGAFIGAVGAFAMFFVISTPVFGVMNICNGLIVEETSNKDTASAANANSFVCGSLYYTEDDKIGEVETYIEKYANIKKEYDDSFVGKFFNFTGLSKAGGATFNRLTTVSQGGITINLTEEFIQIIKIYNGYKDTFVKNKFDITNNAHIDALNNLYKTAVESEIIKNYVVELVPKACSKWSNGEKFLGIEAPLGGDWKEVVLASLEIFKVENINRISSNVDTIFSAIKVANNYAIIDSVNNNQKVEDLLSTKNGFVKDEVLVLTTTNEFRENIATILNESFEALYKQVVGEDIEFENNALSAQEIATFNETNRWSSEAENINATVIEIFDVYQTINKDSSSEALINKLETIGVAIDHARKSRLISKPFKTFITGFIKEKVNLKESTKEEILTNIANNWDDETYNFASMFKAIQEASIVAKDISDNKSNISLDGMKDSLKDIISNESAKDTVASMLESNIIDEMVGEDNKDTADVLTDVLGKLVTSDKVTEETIDNDIKAGEQIVNIVTNVKNNDGDLGLGETEAEKKESADQIVNDLAGSEGVMELLKDSADNPEGSAITDFTKDVSAEDKAVLLESIESNETISAEDKETLKKLFANA